MHSVRLFFFWIPLFLLFPKVILTVINTFSTFFFHHHRDWINLGTSGTALTFCSSGVSETSLPLSSSIGYSLSASQPLSLSSGLSKSPFKLWQFSVSDIHSVEQSWSPSVGWRLIRLIQRTFNTSVRSPGRSFADKAGGTGDCSDNLNAAAPACWKFDQNALMISLVSEMYLTDDICLFWVQDSSNVAHRCWLLCHISTKSRTLAIQCNFICSAYLFFLHLVISTGYIQCWVIASQ